jgi:hypothetical protein
MTNKIYQENSTYTPLLIFPTCQNLFMCPLYRIYCKYHSKKFKKLFFWLQLNILYGSTINKAFRSLTPTIKHIYTQENEGQ